ncbi:MAG: tetratricopeptide repeat protein [Gammaproteobacteria bacterium]|jgi:tetratricopeptide (TPR) repeat protein|nr:tetratricopeptide repeat protein [Gammaproteobacteria bacterium]
MSLLMDALKKAEQEKKEAAKRQLEGEDSSQHESEKKLDDSGSHGTSDAPEAEASSTKANLDNTGRLSTTAELLELEPISTRNEIPETPGIDSAVNADNGAEDQTLNVTMNTLSLAELPAGSVEIDDGDAPDLLNSTIAELQTEDSGHLDETFHGVSLADNSELFQETVQGEAFFPDNDADETYGETLPGIPAAQLAKDIGSEDQPTPVAAQTIFTATKTTESSGNSFKWILGGLCSLALIAGIVWYFVTVTPVNRSALSPQVAEGIESVISPLNQSLDIGADSMSGTLAGATENLSSEMSVSETTVIETALADAQVVESLEQLSTEEPATDELPVGTAEDDATFASVENSDDTEQTGSDQVDTDQDQIAGLPEKIIPEQSLIQISRSKVIEDKGQTLREAYSSYQNGNYEEARLKYDEVLKEFPNNRDALLGLGAIATNMGDHNSAYLHYAHLLSINPRDELAKVALINLQDVSNLSGSESAIHSMLHDNPNAHVLHFTLGSIYAASSRWADAQQAFFEAYRLNSGNSDYALNLAISLDHIGQQNAALDYYMTAMELSDSANLNFDTSRVQKRIDALNKITGR